MKSAALGVASTSFSGALTVILLWALGLYQITVPGEVATSFLVVISAGLHLLAAWLGLPAPPSPQADAPKPAPLFPN